MGGLTLVESILLACWITVHAVMLWDIYKYYTESYHYGTLPFYCCVAAHQEHFVNTLTL